MFLANVTQVSQIIQKHLGSENQIVKRSKEITRILSRVGLIAEGEGIAVADWFWHNCFEIKQIFQHKLLVICWVLIKRRNKELSRTDLGERCSGCYSWVRSCKLDRCKEYFFHWIFQIPIKLTVLFLILIPLNETPLLLLYQISQFIQALHTCEVMIQPKWSWWQRHGEKYL